MSGWICFRGLQSETHLTQNCLKKKEAKCHTSSRKGNYALSWVGQKIWQFSNNITGGTRLILPVWSVRKNKKNHLLVVKCHHVPSWCHICQYALCTLIHCMTRDNSILWIKQEKHEVDLSNPSWQVCRTNTDIQLNCFVREQYTLNLFFFSANHFQLAGKIRTTCQTNSVTENYKIVFGESRKCRWRLTDGF